MNKPEKKHVMKESIVLYGALHCYKSTSHTLRCTEGCDPEFCPSLYVEKIEKYCDELESKLNTYEKALDEAGKFIDDFTQTCPKDMFDYDVRCDECDDDSKWCWKRWLINMKKIGTMEGIVDER